MTQSQPKTQPQIEDIYPLSPSQQGILLNAIAAGADTTSVIYLEISFHDLHGELDLAALRQAWPLVIQRHPALRTGFLWKNRPDPVQFVVKQVAGEVAYVDWRACTGEEQAARQQAYLQSLTTQGLPLGKPPLLQLTLFHLADQHYHACMSGSDDYGPEKTGFDCAKWLVDFCHDNDVPFPRYTIHSMNPVGRLNIDEYISQAASVGFIR